MNQLAMLLYREEKAVPRTAPMHLLDTIFEVPHLHHVTNSDSRKALQATCRQLRRLVRSTMPFEPWQMASIGNFGASLRRHVH